jgi:Bacterial Ig domain
VSDNVRIDKVEFYLDNKLLGYSEVEPYSFKWVLTMENLKIDRNMEPIYETRPITNSDGTISMEQVMVTWVDISPDGKTVTQTWESGKMAIQSTAGYTESHLVHVAAYDAAGNKTESEKVRFFVTHKPKEKKEGQPSGEIWWFDAGWAGILERESRWPPVAAISSPWRVT